MRGKGRALWNDCVTARITPAYAGKRNSRNGSADRRRDHPRVCGEKSVVVACVVCVWGSPPRMRGKADALHRDCLRIGITPAYAGKRPDAFTGWSLLGDHPRVCGEKRCAQRSRHITYGITPAYAGKRLKKSHSTVSPVAIVPLFPSVCNRPVVSNGNPAERDAPLFLPAENTVPASPAYNLRSS